MRIRTCVPATTAWIVACALLQPAAADEAVPTRTLGTVTVVGTRPTSLPTQIPTTIEGITGNDIAATINATDAEDALKYFPSLVVRKRYIGDYDHAVLASRASGTNNSARSLVYADGILLSNLLGNGATFTPRWGMVTPEEIERVDVLYGPFSAAYPGNSVGAVVDYVTRMPKQLEAHAKVASFGEDFEVYGTRDHYTGWQASASVGDRSGNWSWWVNYNRLDSDGHPIAFANKLVSSGTPGSAGTPVTGAIADRNPRNQDWLILGATSQIHTVQDHAKAKLAYDFTGALRLSYTFGWWRNEADRDADTYLRDASGNPVYSGPINVDGRVYTLAPTDISISRGDLQHFMHGLALKSDTRGTWDWEIAASLYDYARDEVRSPLVPLPDARSGGAGRIADQEDTGWNALAFKGTWRPQGFDGAHVVDVGYQRDAYKLRSRLSGTTDWLNGAATTPLSVFDGDTRLQSLYAQDTWRIAEAWRATLGLRFEDWEASNGRSDHYVSPKAALAWQVTPDWALQASIGRAVRNPTVAELFQGSLSTNAVVLNDPYLKPEKSWTGELTAERAFDRGSLRTTFFHEDTRDALYSQTNVTVTPNVTSIQNVDHIRTSGLEVAWQMRDVALDGLDLMSSLTYAHSRIIENDNFPASEGKWQPRVPQWRGNLLASYRIGDNWSASVGARYSGRQYNTLDNSDPNGFTYTGTSSYFVVDARTRYRLTDRCTVSLGIDNLNNETYWAFHPYAQRTYSAEIGVDF